MNFIQPNVTLIASTAVPHEFPELPRQYGQTDAEYLIEWAGRECYQSHHRPNPKTKEYADYLIRTVFQQEHGSIAEHPTATLHMTGVSRSFLAELTRHRMLSFSVLSQRFVDETNARFVLPPAVVPGSSEEQVLDYFVDHVRDAYETLVDNLSEDDLSRKQVREAARSALPNMTATRITVTGNIRAWIDVIKKRTDPGADAEIRRVMHMAREELARHVSPVLFNPENW